MRHLLTMLLLAAALVAQVRVANLAPTPFSGWKRTTVDVAPPFPAGRVGDVTYVVGRKVGLDAWVVDVRVDLAPGQQIEVDLHSSTAIEWSLAPPPAGDAAIAHFGGPLMLGGTPMQVVSLRPDGAAWLVHCWARSGRMLGVDVWLPWYPDQPGWAQGEAMVTASNPTVPDMVATAENLQLQFGDALLLVPGRPFGSPLVDAGTRFGDGQARVFPLSFVWLKHLSRPSDWSSVGVVVNLGVGAVGVKQLLQQGNPTLPNGTDVRAWVATHYQRALAGLHDWSPPMLGPAADTGQTGAVEDQTFVCAEPMALVGSEWVRYFAACKTAQHPMHHRELDGRVVDRDQRPQLRMFYSRPHSSGSDRLGKPRDLQLSESSGWNGPDAQHWTLNTLAPLARIVGTPATQKLLEHHARNYLIQITATPGWSTSAIWSARELGWEGLAAVHLWRSLEDRVLADRVRAHWRERIEKILLPQLGAKDVWDVRKDDARLGTGDWWMPWQQSLGVYGIDLACEVLGPASGRAIALAGAQRILASAWTKDGGRWVEWELLAVDGRRQRSGMFTTAWMPLAVATVLRHEPQNTRARAIWAQMVTDAQGNGRWLPPEVK